MPRTPALLWGSGRFCISLGTIGRRRRIEEGRAEKVQKLFSVAPCQSLAKRGKINPRTVFSLASRLSEDTWSGSLIALSFVISAGLPARNPPGDLRDAGNRLDFSNVIYAEIACDN